MATVYLIRHGQASFGEANYDQLSAVGHRQAAFVGKYLKNHAPPLDVVYGGTLVRHRQTYDGAASANAQLPALTALPGFNEHAAIAIQKLYIEDYVNRNPALKSALQTEGRDAPRFRKMLMPVIFAIQLDWVTGKLSSSDLEPWADFRTRVNDAFTALRQTWPAKANVVIVTSGGVIAALLGLALGLDDRRVIETNWQIKNGSITELHVTSRAVYLQGFNHVHHLPEPALITHV